MSDVGTRAPLVATLSGPLFSSLLALFAVLPLGSCRTPRAEGGAKQSEVSRLLGANDAGLVKELAPTASHAAAAPSATNATPHAANDLAGLRFSDLIVSDVNGDGRSDFVAAVSDASAARDIAVRVYRNPGTSAAVADWAYLELSGPDLMLPRLAVGDIDHDGEWDVVAGSYKQRAIHWWLLARGATEVKAQGHLTVADSLSASAAGGARAASNTEELLLSSLALADVDADGDLDLAVTAFRQNNEAGLVRLYAYGRGNRFEPRKEWQARSALRARFVDLSGEGTLELVSSVYSLRYPLKQPKRSGDKLVWGERFAVEGTTSAPRPLLAHFEPALIEEPPRAAVVDFDVFGVGEAARFALAINAHHCPSENCWDDGTQGGFAQVVDGHGTVLWSSAASELELERRNAKPEQRMRLLANRIHFFDTSTSPGVIAGYWWSFLGEGRCEQRSPCGGPLFATSSLERPFSRLGEDVVMIQGLGALQPPNAAKHRSCLPARGRIVTLPERNVLAVESVESEDGAALQHQWVPDNAFVQLLQAPKSAAVCVVYRAAPVAEVGVVDLYRGPRTVSVPNP